MGNWDWFERTLLNHREHRGLSYSCVDLWIQLPSFFSAVRTLVFCNTWSLSTPKTHTQNLCQDSGQECCNMLDFLKDVIVVLGVTFTFRHDAGIFTDIQPGEFI